MVNLVLVLFFFSSRRRHTRLQGDWSSDVCSSDLDWCSRGRRTHLLPHGAGARRRSHGGITRCRRVCGGWACRCSSRRGVATKDRHSHCRSVLGDRKSTRLNSSHLVISYAVFCLKNKQ